MNECLRSHNNISQGLCLVLLTNKTCLEQCLEHSRSLEYSFCSLWEGGREEGREKERKTPVSPRERRQFAPLISTILPMNFSWRIYDFFQW